MERILPLERGINLRELGGYETADGRHVRWHKLMRSGHLGELSKADKATLKAAGLRQVVDLREEAETIVVPDRPMHGVSFHHMSVYPFTNQLSQNVGFARMARLNRVGLSLAGQAYAQMLTDPHALGVWRELFAVLLKNRRRHQAVLFHCTAGKDRTGVAAFLVLNALGVRRADILRDYMLTNLTFSSLSPSELNELLVPGQDAALVNEMNKQPMVSEQDFKVMELTIQLMAGDFMAYLTNIVGITSRQVARLRKLYLN
ncbi:tyrosine-protein phosphatase [Ligilactobacillus sp. LYQ60]|uniref:tyrosine-protein phosphatase n=1 Tax=unclassified Ligilactobacillus TaxID=2767920 RepID=UPI00385359E0